MGKRARFFVIPGQIIAETMNLLDGKHALDNSPAGFSPLFSIPAIGAFECNPGKGAEAPLNRPLTIRFKESLGQLKTTVFIRIYYQINSSLFQLCLHNEYVAIHGIYGQAVFQGSPDKSVL